jgi:hypothetical protein
MYQNYENILRREMRAELMSENLKGRHHLKVIICQYGSERSMVGELDWRDCYIVKLDFASTGCGKR